MKRSPVREALRALFTILCCVPALAISLGCRDKDAAACPVGSETCPCTTGGNCDEGMTCASDVCVNLSGDASTDTDADADTDVDADMDTDTDTDTNTETDADTDTAMDTATDTDTDADTDADGGDIVSDTGGDADTTTDNDTDTDTDTDTDDEIIAIGIVNDTGSVRYVNWGITIAESFYGSRVLDCSVSPDGEGASWEACLLEVQGCAHLCINLESGGECFYECEPDTIVKEILPGEKVEIPWPVKLLRENVEYCMADTGSCYDVVPAPFGLYRFSVSVFDSIDCGPNSCEPDADGFYYDVPLTGSATSHAVDLTIPAALTDFEIALE